MSAPLLLRVWRAERPPRVCAAARSYNIALCYYCMRQFGPALKNIAEVRGAG